MPADVLAYWADHDDFPHQSTADQFFEESQFESYRALGEQICEQRIRAAPNKLDDMVVAAERVRGATKSGDSGDGTSMAAKTRWRGPPPHPE